MEDGWFHWRLSQILSTGDCLDLSGTGGTIDPVTVDTICATIPAPGATALAARNVPCRLDLASARLISWVVRLRANQEGESQEV
jgi:hypothetical protein